MKELLKRGFTDMGIAYTEEMLDKFAQYYQSVLDYNKMVNLTAITEKNDFCIKHFLDSVSAAKYITMGASICDIGSGAGFPCIPLKLVRDDLSCTMIDSLGKRVVFLEQMIASLCLTKTTALHLRAEEAGRNNLRGSFDYVVARAVSSLPTLLEYCIPLLKVGGTLIAYKSQYESELEASKNAMIKLKCEVDDIQTFSLPMSDMSRSLIFIKKMGATDKQYPRQGGKPKNNPL